MLSPHSYPSRVPSRGNASASGWRASLPSSSSRPPGGGCDSPVPVTAYLLIAAAGVAVMGAIGFVSAWAPERLLTVLVLVGGVPLLLLAGAAIAVVRGARQ